MGDYQYYRLYFVCDVKSALLYKECLVYGGSKVEPLWLSTCATVMKGIPARLFLFLLFKVIIANSHNLRVLYCDIDNALIQPNTKDKIYTCCGSEFSKRTTSVTISVLALYSPTISAEHS